MAEKNWIAGPMEVNIPQGTINGVPLAIVADLPEGGFLAIVSGENPVALPTPSVGIAKGAMLVILPAEIAAHLRPTLKQARRQNALGIVDRNPQHRIDVQ